MPLRDFECLDCGHKQEQLILGGEEVDCCQQCGSGQMQVCLSFPSNYTIAGDNSASVRPKRMGGK